MHILISYVIEQHHCLVLTLTWKIIMETGQCALMNLTNYGSTSNKAMNFYKVME